MTERKMQLCSLHVCLVSYHKKKPLTIIRERFFPYPQRPESQLRISLASLSPASSRIQSTKSKGLDTVYTPFL